MSDEMFAWESMILKQRYMIKFFSEIVLISAQDKEAVSDVTK